MNTQYWSYLRGFLIVLGVVFWWVDANAQFSFNRVEGDQGWLLEMPLDTATNGKNHEFDLGPIVKATAPFMKISFPSISPSQLPSLALEEINVKGGGFDILNGSTIPIPLNHTALGAVDVCVGFIDQSYVIENLGVGQLDIDGITVSGPDFTMLTIFSTQINLNQNNTFSFTVRFDPTQIGVQNATVTIDNNDNDEDPYVFAISGTGLADVINPTITCPPNISASADVNSCSKAVPYTAPAVGDNCGVASTAQTLGQASGTIFPIGITNNIYVVTDLSGLTGTCSFIVNVTDNTPPVAVCQSTSTALIGNTAVVSSNAVNNGSHDNCAVTNVSLSPATFHCGDVGSQTVTLTVTDAALHSVTCTTTVLVRDLTPPAPHCQNATVYLDGTGHAYPAGSIVNNGSTDNCSIASLSLNPPDFHCSQQGNTIAVILTVTDIDGNTATCSTTVTVADNLPPTAACQDVTVSLNSNGNASTTASAVNNASSDNCGVSAMTLSNMNFTCANVGSNLVTLTVTDVASNPATCTAHVIVEDHIPPIAHCHGATVTLNAQGSASIAAAAINNVSTDNCGINTYSLSQSNFSCANLGPNNVKLIVEDASGNRDSCNANVQVRSQIWNVQATPVTKPCGPYHISCAGGNDGVAHVTANASCGGISYYWSDSSTGSTATGLRDGINYVTVTDISGIVVIDTFEIIEPAPMTITPGSINSICPEDSNGTLSISATSPNVCTGHGLSYAWSNGATTASIVNLTPGPYIVTVSDDQGCTLTQQLILPAFPSPMPEFIVNGNNLEATQSWSTYQWYYNGQPIQGANSILYPFSGSGPYYLLVTDANGCEGVSPVQTITGIWEPSGKGLHLSVFPNPAQGTCYLRTADPILGDLQVSISDVYGRQFSRQVLTGLERDAALEIRGLAAGHYWVDVLTEEGERQVLRLVVQ